MPLANFFGKAVLAASQLIRGFDADQFAARLNDHAIAVSATDIGETDFEARTAIELTVNLLSRLYPTLALDLNGCEGSFREDMLRLATSINPQISIVDTQKATIRIAIGKTVPTSSAKSFFVGSNAWTANFSTECPQCCGQSRIPFGAAAAACLAAANVFRFIFAAELGNDGDLDKNINLSLLSMSDSDEPLPLTADHVEIGSCFLIGVGAIGNAVIWALARVDSLRGEMHLIDSEAISSSNLQRYVLSNQEHVREEMTKVQIGAAAFSPSEQFQAYPHPSKWGEYLKIRQNWNLPTALVAVDSAESRCEVQAALPKTIFNAWTGANGDVGISRHFLFGHDACLMCLYMPPDNQKNLDQLVAESIRMPQNFMEIRKLLHTGEGLTHETIAAIAAANAVPEQELLQFVGKPLITFYSEAICGGLLMKLGKETQIEEEVPMAFQSALAGVLLAAQLVSYAMRASPALPTTTRFRLTRDLPSELSFKMPQHPSGRCICADKDFINSYRTKYAPV